MPTASRLIAALLMAGTGIILALELRELRDSLRFYPFFIEFNALLGAVIGWKLVGARVVLAHEEMVQVARPRRRRRAQPAQVALLVGERLALSVCGREDRPKDLR